MILFETLHCRYNREIDGIYRLRDSTVVCAKCHLRIIVDTIQPNVKYCKCGKCGVLPSAASNEDCKFFFYQLFNIGRNVLLYSYMYICFKIHFYVVYVKCICNIRNMYSRWLATFHRASGYVDMEENRAWFRRIICL